MVARLSERSLPGALPTVRSILLDTFVSDDRDLDAAPARRGGVWLALGAAAGVGLALSGLLHPLRMAGPALPPDAVARVNGVTVRVEDYERVVAGLAQDRRDGVDAAQRRHVLDRLIDEELLVQRGLALGLARSDRQVRSDLTAAVIASVVGQRDDAEPTDSALQAFYDAHRDFFTRPGRLRLREVFCHTVAGADDAAVLARAQQASRRLQAGESFDAVRAALGDAEVSPVPDALLPPAKLLDYLGPTALQAALALRVGGVSDPVRASAGYHVLQVIERQGDTVPEFLEIKPQVLAEFRRQSGEQALRAYLDDLRAHADVLITPALR